MYATVFKADPLDAKRWQRYRESILLPGSSRDELDLLKVKAANCTTKNATPANYIFLRAQDFLGRSPNAEAFVQGLRGGSATEMVDE